MELLLLLSILAWNSSFATLNKWPGYSRSRKRSDKISIDQNDSGLQRTKKEGEYYITRFGTECSQRNLYSLLWDLLRRLIEESSPTGQKRVVEVLDLSFKALHGTDPGYLRNRPTSQWNWLFSQELAEGAWCRYRRSRNFGWLCPGEETFPLCLLPFGTLYPLSDWQPLYWPSVRAWRPIWLYQLTWDPNRAIPFWNQHWIREDPQLSLCTSALLLIIIN